ncbi:hypothetical protein M0R45_025041 [Rubus argutus]|uniref:MATH domain-containing protein n=1 Tax=Rubus argutus TaxID=59490 RepID=A0AAW1WSX8_RUBAR
MTIDSFSSLKLEDRYESEEFDVRGYKWKLVLLPTGNKKRNVTDHISLYLELGGQKPIEPGWIVTAGYKFFLLNRQKEKKTYLVVEDVNKKEKYCFYQTIVGGLAGFDRFISLEDFNDASKGYLVDDTCQFGAEVSVSKTRSKGKRELVSMNLNTVMYKHVWKVFNFSKLNAEFYHSLPFMAGEQKYCAWKLQIYPKGLSIGKGSHLSVYLQLDNTRFPTSTKILVEFTLRIMDQIHGMHCSSHGKCWFTAPHLGWGFHQLITQEANASFLKNDTCIVEAEITIRGISMPAISTS